MKTINAVILGIVVAIIIILAVVGIVYFKSIQKPEGNKNSYCQVSEEHLRNLGCVSDYSCRFSSGICDLNIHKCVDANINLKAQVNLPQTKEECEEVRGSWISVINEN